MRGKMQTYKKKIQHKKKVAIAGACAGVAMALLCVWNAQADGPEASIVAYGNKAEQGLRSSQLLEVSTEGFPENAKLEYTYEITGEEADRVVAGVNSPSLVTGQSIYGDERYFYVKGTDEWKGTIKVTVTDEHTGERATVTYDKGLEKANLTKDLKASTYGVIAGQSEDIRSMLAAGGILEANTEHTSVADLEVATDSAVAFSDLQKESRTGSFLNFTDYKMTVPSGTTEAGKLNVLVSKNGSVCHGSMGGSAKIGVWVFQKPTISTKDQVGDHQAEITDGQPGVTYYIDGTGQTWKEDTTSLVYQGLAADTTYQAACVNAENAVVYLPVTTRKEYQVQFATRGLGTAVAAQTVVEGECISLPEEPKASGYTFGGWFTDRSGTQAYDSTVPVTENETLYAKWTANTYKTTINLQEDGAFWSGQTVALYDTKGNGLYEMTERAQAYENSAVKAGTYAVYVNGTDSGETITVSGEQTAEVSYQTAKVQVTIDQNPAGDLLVTGENTVDSEDTITFTETSNSSYNYEAHIPASRVYTVFVNGRKAGTTQAGIVAVTGVTAKITLQNGNENLTGKQVYLKNGTTRISCQEKNQVYRAVLWDTASYTVYAEGMDSGVNTGVSITKADAGKTIAYHTVKVYGKTTSKAAGQWIVQDKTSFAKPEESLAKKAGYVFQYWGQTASDSKDAFENGAVLIQKDTDFYAQYEKQAIVIGDYQKHKDGTDFYWTMPNLGITGFDQIKEIVLEADKGKLEVTKEADYSITSVDNGTYVTISFASNVSRATAQRVLRENVKIWTTGQNAEAQNVKITISEE